MPDLPDELAALLRERAEAAPAPAAPSDRVVHAVRRRQHARAGAFVTGTALALVAVVGVASALMPAGGATLTPASPNGVRGGESPYVPSPQGTAHDLCGVELSPEDASLLVPRPPADGSPATAPAPDPETETTEPDPETETTEPDPETETTEPGAGPTEGPGKPPPHPATEPPPTGAGTGYGFHVRIPEGGGEPQFGKVEYTVPAGSSCLIVDNDFGAPHLLRLTDEQTGAVEWEVPLVEDRSSYLFQAPDSISAGRYRLVCSIHPMMKATVVVS